MLSLQSVFPLCLESLKLLYSRSSRILPHALSLLMLLAMHLGRTPTCGVPQGPVLGPLQLIPYTS